LEYRSDQQAGQTDGQSTSTGLADHHGVVEGVRRVVAVRTNESDQKPEQPTTMPMVVSLQMLPTSSCPWSDCSSWS
jgi:hypothetical protein